MNKSTIKGFSIRARRKLIQDITQKAFSLGIKGDKEHEDIEEFEGGFRVKSDKNQIVYPMEQKAHRDKLIAEVNRKGYEQVMEEVAYTWFNRIIAIRFMEVNEYLPVKIRILSSETEGKIEPDVLTNVYDYVDELELDKEDVFELKENHRDEELFKYIFVKECNKLGVLMPQVFEKICDFTELLLPDQLLLSDSVIRDLIDSIEEDDFREEVEIIGWMYQYYISEKKDEVFAGLKKNKKITKENIPAATQLFTPKWIVKYMTENSLGRLWQDSHPNEELKKKWEYYIEPTEQEDEVQRQLDELKNPNLSPEDIKILDPAMGSGHILVYAFEVLYEIYLSRGYAEKEIPQLILEKNLYGLDIDDRAAQLASFALLVKARSKNRRFFRKPVELNICSIQESNGFSNEALEYLVNPDETQIEKLIHLSEAKYLIDVYKNAKDFGSILKIKESNLSILKARIEEIKDGTNLNMFEFGYRNEILSRFPMLIKQSEILMQKYNAVISNPPYMGSSGMSPVLSDYLKANYPITKEDLYAVFIEKCNSLLHESGYQSMITMHSWMFLSSYQLLREKILGQRLINMIHLGSRAFDNDVGTIVQATSFTVSKHNVDRYIGCYINLQNFNSPEMKEIEFHDDENYHYVDIHKMNYLPSNPIAYWISDSILKVFEEGENITNYIDTFQGIITGNNKKFLRYWHEINIKKFAVGRNDMNKIDLDIEYWIPYNKGGSTRRWYGVHDYVINWKNGYSDKTRGRNTSSHFYLRSYSAWSYTVTDSIPMRYYPEGFLWDVRGSGIMPKTDKLYYLMAMISSKVGIYLLKVNNSTLSCQVENILQMPIIIKSEYEERVNQIVNENIEISHLDWDEHEISWNFRSSPLISIAKVSEVKNIRKVWEIYQENCRKRFKQIKRNEEELNSIFIEIYNLRDEITNEVNDKDIFVHYADEVIDVKALISYFIGSVFGRYSLEKEGVIYAGGEFDQSAYQKFNHSEDNILLISDEDYSEGDVLHRFVEFIKLNFGNDTLEENLNYIASVVNPKSKGTTRQIIRNYFVKDFYNDHCKVYKKRPIYWMIDSGKQNGIKALFYMHRYDKSTVARFRTDYLHEIQRAFENDIELTMKSSDGKGKKRVDDLKKKLTEVNEFDKVVAHIAHQQIEIDLDNGVEHNYELFQGIEVPQGDSSTFKANLLAKRK